MPAWFLSVVFHLFERIADPASVRADAALTGVRSELSGALNRQIRLKTSPGSPDGRKKAGAS